MKTKRKSCEYCKQFKSNVKRSVNPFWEIEHGEINVLNLCKSCFEQAKTDND